ncbi:MAG: prolipoprotein diacylglyceryl transferase [Clostridia bacterium]|nr:prolipoprotein diacylglyceryl transferase [Clostridia bacterium]
MKILEFIASIYSKPLNITLGIAGLLGIIWLILVRKRLKMHWIVAIIASSALVIYAVYAVKFFALVEAGFDPAKSGGMSLYGVPFFVPIPLLLGALIAKRPIGEVFDIFSVNTVLICMGGRANCFFYGCCQGIEIASLGFRVPTREIEMFFYLIFLILMIPRVYTKKANGTAFPFYMAGYGILRFILEFFRDTNFTTIFHLAHVWSALCALIGISIVISVHEKKKHDRGKRITT